MARPSGSPPSHSTADLVYDTKQQPLAAGTRATIQRARRLLYAADQTELVLQMTPAGAAKQVRLFGQVLDDGLPVEGAAVSLRGAASVVDRATDEEGQFRVAELNVGSYDLDVATETGLVHVPNLDVA